MILNPFNCFKAAAANLKNHTRVTPAEKCATCSQSQTKCGLFEINPNVERLLADMFTVKIKVDQKMCVTCLSFINVADEFKEMALLSTNMKRERSVSAEPGDDTETEIEEKKDFEAISTEEVQVAPPSVIARPPRTSAIIAKSSFTENIFQCKHCPKSFKTNLNLVKHSTRVHAKVVVNQLKRPAPRDTFNPRNLFECDLCFLVCKKKTTLKHHMQLRHIKVPRVVPCSSIPDTNSTYKPSFKEGAWYCCDKKIGSKTNLNAHKSLKHRDAIVVKPCVCRIFKATIESRKELANHYKKVHKNRLKSYKRGRTKKQTKSSIKDLGQGSVSEPPKVVAIRRSQRILDLLLCTICTVKYESAMELDVHQLMYHEDQKNALGAIKIEQI